MGQRFLSDVPPVDRDRPDRERLLRSVGRDGRPRRRRPPGPDRRRAAVRVAAGCAGPRRGVPRARERRLRGDAGVDRARLAEPAARRAEHEPGHRRRRRGRARGPLDPLGGRACWCSPGSSTRARRCRRRVFRVPGTGAFGPALLGDLDGDGRADLVSAQGGHGHDLAIGAGPAAVRGRAGGAGCLGARADARHRRRRPRRSDRQHGAGRGGAVPRLRRGRAGLRWRAGHRSGMDDHPPRLRRGAGPER